MWGNEWNSHLSHNIITISGLQADSSIGWTKSLRGLFCRTLLTISFEGSKVTGKPGDGGEDAIGVLDVANSCRNQSC